MKIKPKNIWKFCSLGRPLTLAALVVSVLLPTPRALIRPAKAGPMATLEGAYPLASLKTLKSCVKRLKRSYFDPPRIKPKEMVFESIQSLQKHVLPLLVDRTKSEDGSSDVLTVQIGDQSQDFDLVNVQDLDGVLEVMERIFRFLDAHLPADAAREDLETYATNALLHTLDPHTTYLDPGSYRDMQVETSGKFGGLGIVISLVEGQLTVINVMDETPAAKAGLKARDKIIQIDDESTVNMELSEAVSRMRGKPGTPVTIHVTRASWSEPKIIPITRARIVIRSVVSQLLGDGCSPESTKGCSGVGYLRIKNFRANTTSQMAIHLRKLERALNRPLSGLIIDLRGDPGGFLEQAIRVSDFFLKDGEIVRTIGAGGKLREKREAKKNSQESIAKDLKSRFESIPLVVMVDPGSASASEIVSGALKNHNRALIIGNKSFGKGTVQGIYEIGDGAIKMTIAEYLTPGGVPVHEVGVIPHIKLQAAYPDKDTMIVFAPDVVTPSEQKLAPEGTARRKAQMTKPLRVMRFVKAPIDDSEEAIKERRFKYDELKRDFALEVAHSVLKAGKSSQADVLLAKGRTALRNLEKREERRLKKALLEHGVDWSLGPQVARPRLEAKVTTSLPDATVEAGSSMQISVRLRNTGNRPLHRLHAVASSTTRLLNHREFLFGKLDPGKAMSWTITVKPDLSAYERTDPLTVEFYQDGQKLDLSRRQLVRVKAAPRPDFEFTCLVDDEGGGNGDGRIQPGERINVTVRIKNRGTGPTKETTTYLKNLAGDNVFLEKGRKTEMKPIAVGAMRDIQFTFEVRPTMSATGIPLEVSVRDTKNAVYLYERITLPLHPATSLVGSKADGAVYANEALSLYGGASSRFPKVASIRKGTRMTKIGQAGSWSKVRIEQKISGWLRTANLNKKRVPSAQTGARTYLSYRPPKIEILAPTPTNRVITSDKVRIQGKVTFFPSEERVDRAVTIFVRNEKVWFHLRKEGEDSPLTIPFDIKVSAEDGINRIRVSAMEKDQVDVFQSFFIYKEEIK